MLPPPVIAGSSAKRPSTLAADKSSGGLGVRMTFERVIVWPDGHREIEGVTPKRLAPPSHTLPSDDSSTQHDCNTIVEDQ